MAFLVPAALLAACAAPAKTAAPSASPTPAGLPSTVALVDSANFASDPGVLTFARSVGLQMQSVNSGHVEPGLLDTVGVVVQANLQAALQSSWDQKLTASQVPVKIHVLDVQDVSSTEKQVTTCTWIASRSVYPQGAAPDPQDLRWAKETVSVAINGGYWRVMAVAPGGNCALAAP